MEYKLGKKPAVHDPKALRFGDYLPETALPYIPSAYHWGTGVPKWPMYGNDTLGDCTVAAIGHHAGVWTFRESGQELIIPETAIVESYSAVSGYIPGNESTDNGAVMTDVLKYWTSTGVGGCKIEAYATIEPRNNSELEAAIYLMGGAYIGINMPVTANAQTKINGTWSLVPGYKNNPDAQPGSWGGHCVPIIGYSKSLLQVISWGMPIYMTWAFYNYYSDEAFAPFSEEWVAVSDTAPNHFNSAQLLTDMKLL